MVSKKRIKATSKHFPRKSICLVLDKKIVRQHDILFVFVYSKLSNPVGVYRSMLKIPNTIPQIKTMYRKYIQLDVVVILLNPDC